jgi:uncharacterized protein (DUF433 family)
MKTGVTKGRSTRRPTTEAGVAPTTPAAQFDRITFEPGKMGGRACIRGMRVTVGVVVSLIAEGVSREDILKDYPYLELEDIRQALGYAAWLTREEVILA